MAGNPFPLGKHELLEAYRKMRTIREFEERLHVDFGRGDIPGFVHLYAGEEAAGVGIISHLGDGDRIASTHRGHGHCIAKGVDPVAMMKEIYGQQRRLLRGQGRLDAHRRPVQGHDGRQRHPRRRRAAGVRRGAGRQVPQEGRGGDQLRRRRREQPGHLPRKPEPGRGVEPAGDLRRREQRLRRVDVARLRRRGRSYVDRAAGFGLPGVTVDGTDFFAVHEAAGEIIRRARSGGGPALLECKMVRFFGHFEGDAQTYRGPGELDDNRANQDCLRKFAAAVTAAGVITANELAAIDRDVLGLIERAVTQAKAAPLPTAADLTTDVYVSY